MYTPNEKTIEQFERAFKGDTNTDQEVRAAEVREALHSLSLLVTQHTPASREQALVLTKLEEAYFWFRAALRRE